jgi:hypothetical protein
MSAASKVSDWERSPWQVPNELARWLSAISEVPESEVQAPVEPSEKAVDCAAGNTSKLSWGTRRNGYTSLTPFRRREVYSLG